MDGPDVDVNGPDVDAYGPDVDANGPDIDVIGPDVGAGGCADSGGCGGGGSATGGADAVSITSVFSAGILRRPARLIALRMFCAASHASLPSAMCSSLLGTACVVVDAGCVGGNVGLVWTRGAVVNGEEREGGEACDVIEGFGFVAVVDDVPPVCGRLVVRREVLPPSQSLCRKYLPASFFPNLPRL